LAAEELVSQNSGKFRSHWEFLPIWMPRTNRCACAQDQRGLSFADLFRQERRNVHAI